MDKELELTKSTGNVFADLGLQDADDLLAKAKLAISVVNIIEQRGLTQHQAAKLLGTDQSNLSRLKKGRDLEQFTFDRLMHWLVKLDRDVTITVKKSRKKRTNISVAA